MTVNQATEIQFDRIAALGELADLRAEAAMQGFRFLERLVSDWESGMNRFDGAGECLLGAFICGCLAGVGGINRDPYSGGENVGRLRHLYVLEAYRRRGVALAIVSHLIAQAHGQFREVRLRTDGVAADAFYRRLGFAPLADPCATHAVTVLEKPRAADLL